MTKRSTRKVVHRQPRQPGDRIGGDGQSVLGRLTDHESATILRVLLQRHDSLLPEAEKLAGELVSVSSSDDVTDSVLDALTSVDLDDLNDRAGATRWGYVEPTEAAWELLEEAVEDFIADLKRRAELGSSDAAVMMCRGIVAGLYKAKDVPSDGALGWAPDFPVEEARHVVSELLRAIPDQTRDAIRARFLEAIVADAPDWAEMLIRAASEGD